MPCLDTGELVEFVGEGDAKGQRGQLTSWDDVRGVWCMATFDASVLSAKEDQLRPLKAEDVECFDLALGPASNMQVMGEEILANLTKKGYTTCKLFVSPIDLADMVAAADKGVSQGAFSRLAAELEPGCLGRDGTGKTLSLDMSIPETADLVKDSALRVAEDYIATIGTILRPYSEGYDGLGFDLYSRSATMLSMPFDGDEADYEPPELENEDAANFLTMMWRSKLTVLFNAGPTSASLTLMPKCGGQDETVIIDPGMMALFLVDRHQFSYEPNGKALCLSTFYLDVPKEYSIDNVYGDLSNMQGTASGPPMPPKDQIPVVSMGTRYAFGADEPWKVWVAYSKAGWDTHIKHPFLRWDVDIYYEENADQTSGKSYTCHGGFSDGIELFDCRFFDISPAEAKGMDPTQRQVLEVSYMSLHGAGYTKKMLQAKPANIAGLVGLDKNEWQGIPKGDMGGFGASSSANAITSNRFNYCMNLKGASMTIDTACSSSLVAQHTGKLYLLFKNYDACEAAIVCGVNLSLSPMSYIGCCQAGMHSHQGRCFTYNSSADGYARGEATASSGIKLKNFDSEAGDYCLLAGSQVNQDGRSASLTAPNGPAQERCSRAVISEVGIKSSEVDATECHGTGTSLGDPIEIGAYKKLMKSQPRTNPVVVTTSKSNIGHCEGSAGISGFLKCVLMSMYSEGCPNVHLRALNPHLDMEDFSGIIVSEGLPYAGDASYNSVLSFGFGGTNACAMLWGTNTMTSRALAAKDVQATFMKWVHNAPAQEVIITGDDWEEWEMDFPIRNPKSTDRWDIEVDEDGMATYLLQKRPVPDAESEFFLSGTFNDWGHELLATSSDLPGLYVAEITIGPSGYEEFQVVTNMDSDKVYSAAQPSCEEKGTAAVGPSTAEREYSWCARGEQGETFRIEFFLRKARPATVSWVRER